MKGQNDVNSDDERLTLILQDNYSGGDVAETLIIRDAKALNSFYSKVNRTRKPGIPVPKIDFSKEMILIYCTGEQTNGKHARLAIEEESEKEVIISTSVEKSIKEGPNAALTSPFSVYKMPLTQKEISFNIKK
ncbi:MAG: hypothetical protein KJO63_14275 [Maribacter sp.]|nr:hypothetical protein [Maribacter sp.]